MAPRIVIVPNELDTLIRAEVNRFLALYPETASERANMEADLLRAFDRYGVVATLAPRLARTDV